MITENDLTPEELLFKMEKEHEIEEAYFLDENGSNHWLKKPFSGIEEAGSYCMQLGRLIGGLNLAKGMVTLDWGAGSCWLSEIMNKLGMKTISLDISKSALEVGAKLFKLDKRIDMSLNPQFIHYDGRKIPLPDESVDRIVISWAFHHIVNKIEILNEFYRVLKPNGIVGFMDAGLAYDESDMAKHEKETFGALEDNIDLEKLDVIATNIGFKEILVTYSPESNLKFKFYNYKKREQDKEQLFKSCLDYGSTHEVFFIIKGTPYKKDSATPGKNCKALIEVLKYSKLANSLEVTLKITNCGDTVFLHENNIDAGTVFVGAHLYYNDKNLIKLDLARSRIPHDIDPNNNFNLVFNVPISNDFSGHVEIDLVNEGHWWFKQKGTISQFIKC
jgi:ubiquinone/menaquinone biosynthesis C-methylase UbiE